MTKQVSNFLQFIKEFADDAACLKQLTEIRWTNSVPVCPYCGGTDLYVITKKPDYKCKNKTCAKKFNVFTGSIFENSKIPLRTWFIAIYICANHKKGISSHQLARDLGITQKTAWFVLGRVREMLKSKAPFMVASPDNNTFVEIDETYVGGKAKNKHNKERRELIKNGTGGANKTMVFGILERKGNVQTHIVKNPNGATLKPIIREQVSKDVTIVTDSHGAYTDLGKEYKQHEVVMHSLSEYVRGEFHTNSIEGFWSQLKRGIYGVYHHCSPQHLHRYCSEFEYRHNTRKQGEGERFNNALAQSNKRLRYSELISETK